MLDFLSKNVVKKNKSQFEIGENKLFIVSVVIRSRLKVGDAIIVRRRLQFFQGK